MSQPSSTTTTCTSTLTHRRTHNLLLISKLLNQKDNTTSPFTLISDTLEQPATPLVREYIKRANISKTHVIFLGFETTSTTQSNSSNINKPNNGIDTFIPCYNKTPTQISQSVSTTITHIINNNNNNNNNSNKTNKRILLIIDSLHPLCLSSLDPRSNLNLTGYLSSLLAPPIHQTTTQISMVAVYHTDIPLPPPHPSSSQSYSPSPINLLSYLATTLLTAHSLSILLSDKYASERSHIPPVYGLSEGKEGVIIGLKPVKFPSHSSSSRGGVTLRPEDKGVVLELEHRRKSGRGVREWYFLPASKSKSSNHSADVRGSKIPQAFRETIILLDDHPLFRKEIDIESKLSDQELAAGMTFELGLTDRQRLEREGVVLPYFDAQKGGGFGGPGEGGRILYDMGEEDDFDEEEDEI